MAIHYYDKSPSGPPEQLARLGPPTAVLKAGIPCVVWAEDALSIVHFVPTVLFDQQLLVPDDAIDAALSAICSSYPYVRSETDPNDTWYEHRLVNSDRPYAYHLNSTTKLLVHRNPQLAWERSEPQRILVHASSLYHFDLDDPARTCHNPEPPNTDSRDLLFPNLHAFYDALIDTRFEPPHPFIHYGLMTRLDTWIAYLNQYTLSDEGMMWKADAPVGERVLLDVCLELLWRVKEENRPHLIRKFLQEPQLDFLSGADERIELKKEKCNRMGIPYIPPKFGIPYNPFKGKRYRPPSVVEPRLTPYLVRGPSGNLALNWRALPKYMTMARKLVR